MIDIDNFELGLNLDRPMIFFDLETTGVNLANDRIWEIATVKFFPDGNKEVKVRRLNPGDDFMENSSEDLAALIAQLQDKPIEDARVEVENLKNEPTFKQISKNLYIYMEDCDLAGYNIARFDVPLLSNEFKRTGLDFSTEGRRIIDAYTIFCQKEPRSLEAAYKFFCSDDMVGAHDAKADTLATVGVFAGQLKKYSDLPRDLDALHEFCNQKNESWIDSTGKFKWQGKSAIVGFGRNAGMKLEDIAKDNPGFLSWMLKTDFPDDAKKVAQNALQGIFPQHQEKS
jgi:DNA polymerase-3 subunit epsilon